MGKRERDKGLRGELEVRHEFERAGIPVRGLEGQGDKLVLVAPGITLHVEAKRQETLRVDLWSRQAEAEAPAEALPVVAYRRSREPWRVNIGLTDLINLLLEIRHRQP